MLFGMKGRWASEVLFYAEKFCERGRHFHGENLERGRRGAEGPSSLILRAPIGGARGGRAARWTAFDAGGRHRGQCLSWPSCGDRLDVRAGGRVRCGSKLRPKGGIWSFGRAAMEGLDPIGRDVRNLRASLNGLRR